MVCFSALTVVRIHLDSLNRHSPVPSLWDSRMVSSFVFLKLSTIEFNVFSGLRIADAKGEV